MSLSQTLTLTPPPPSFRYERYSYPPAEVQALAEGLPSGSTTLGWIDSPHGHDSFLIEQEQVSQAIRLWRDGLFAPGQLQVQKEEGGKKGLQGKSNITSAAWVLLLLLLSRAK